jgi:hypothetical protein
MKRGTIDWGSAIMKGTSYLSTFSMAITSIASIIDVWNDENLSGWEKFSRILMSIGFLSPSIGLVVKMIKALKTGEAENTAILVLNSIARKYNNKLKQEGATASDISEK